MLGDTAAATRDAGAAVTILTPIGDSWALVHAEAMLGGVAQAEHRFEDAARALASAAGRSRALGFVGQAALHLATLARVQHRAGDTDRAIGTFDRAIAAALAGGDGRLAATARLNLARLLRARGDLVGAVSLLEQNLRWYEHAGGGDGALLTRGLLCAETRDVAGLAEVLDEAGTVENQEVRVYVLDALAHEAAARGEDARAERLLGEADALAAVVAHLVDDGDRLDGARARDRLAGAPG